MEIELKALEKSYKVIIQRGLLENVASFVDGYNKILLVSDDIVFDLYKDKLSSLLPNAEFFVIPHGEKGKTIKQYEKILQFLLDNDFSRKDCLIAFGGGVVSDLTGFAAATYKRGIDFINIPTSLLAMVDASVGGKTAINFGGLKNSVGAFYQPRVVLVDLNVLETLPTRQVNNGLVEALKTGLIYDEELFNLFKRRDYKKHLEEIVVRSVKAKAEVVCLDEKESGIRKILNFGHTFGHAYEEYFGMKKYLHGEAVALGMLTVSKDKYYYEDLLKIIKKLKINNSVDVDNERIIELIKNDKKSFGDNVDLIVVEKIGTAKIVSTKISDLYEYMR